MRSLNINIFIINYWCGQINAEEMQRASGTYCKDQNRYIYVRKHIGRYHYENPVGPKLLKRISNKQNRYSWIEVVLRGRAV
jgi:hypothetical protein